MIILNSVITVQKYGNLRQYWKKKSIDCPNIITFQNNFHRDNRRFLIKNLHQKLYLLVNMFNFNFQSIIGQKNIFRKALLYFMMKSYKMT